MNGVTVMQTLVAAEQRRAALPAELAGSLVLSAADALVSLSLKVGPHELMLLDDGTVRVCGGTPTDETTSEKSLREVLDQLLLSSSSVTPALLRASRRPSRGNIAELVRELEVALIPTNRGAARRALSRLCREVGLALEQSPEIRQVADARTEAQTRSESAPVPVAAPAPPPVEMEPELIEDLDIIEMSPSLPVVPEVPVAAPVPIHSPQSLEGFDIPDLEIPDVSKAEFLQPVVGWQPVEHTVRLEMPQRTTSHSSFMTQPLGHRSSGLCQSAAVQLGYVELFDEEVDEATAELPSKPPLKSLAPPKPPTRQRTLQANDAPTPSMAAPLNEESLTAEPFLLVVPALEHPATPYALDDASSKDSRAEGLDPATEDSVPQQQIQAAFESPSDVILRPALESEPEFLQAESDHTQLDVATFVEDGESANEQRTLEPSMPLPSVPVRPINWRRQALSASPPIAHDVEWDEKETNSGNFEAIPDVQDLASEPAQEPIWEPHRYSAEPQLQASPSDLEARILAFTVREQGNALELQAGLRHLAGLDGSQRSELSVTPPPLAYDPEISEEAQTSSSKNPLVRTLIGLGAVGTLLVLVSSSFAPHSRTASPSNAGLNVEHPAGCLAAVAVADVPVGASVRVTQPGKEPSPMVTQVGHVPLTFDGLACGTPAELLVKMASGSWFRVPVESWRLSRATNPEPIRLAALDGGQPRYRQP